MRQLRWNVVILTFLLLCTGIIFLYSSSGVYSELVFKDSLYYVKRQIIFIFIGLLAAFWSYAIDLRKMAAKSRVLILIAFILLILVLLFGTRAGSAKRWFRLGSLGIQPVEFVKILFIFYLADFLAKKKNFYRNFKVICLPIYTIVGIFMVLLLLQPDFGNAMFMGFVGISLLYFAGLPVKFLLYTVLGAVPFVIAAFIKLPYLKYRVLGFLSPWRYPESIGFQLIQSFIAIGSGRLWGQGLGLSRQKLFYLPQAHNDFIFSIIAEELGFFGASVLILAYVLLIWNFINILSNVKNLFERLLLTGLTLSFSYQIIINLGVCLGLLPTKGLPLPFLSYGGSSLISNMMMVGIVLNISKSCFDPEKNY
ncbi:MAG TPA: putative lipid II flippase FtsW [Candidatus Omnitrophica bacterium]|nr:putative lipid II flippase FtsW [Candidatus Omnitrophota bacterium]